LDLFGKQIPEIGLVPAKLVARAITVVANTRAETANLPEELFAFHGIEILIEGRT
jgi:hypothetical protein